MATTMQRLRNLNCIFMCVTAYISLLIVLNNKYQRSTVVNPTEVNKVNRRSTHNPRQNNVMKYILLADGLLRPLQFYKEGQDAFIINRCKPSNCYLTYNSTYLESPSDFDAVVLSGYSMRSVRNRPYESRSSKQKYVFATTEPSSIYPVTNPLFDDFFNWTWTYRLESDLTFTYIKIYDLEGKVIGPAVDMKWPEILKPIDDELKRKLRLKNKAVAWFTSHCATQSRREHFVKEFQEESRKYGFSVDVFGTCGQFMCIKSMWCSKMLEKYYYFYFSFENSLDIDYVTEKLLNALDNLVVPVVYGGANYSRFLAPGSYLNAKELGPNKLAKVMNDAIRNSTLYYDYFRWRNHFKYESSETTSELCNICSALNDKEKIKTNVVTNFRNWWNTPTRQKTYDVLLKTFLMDKSLQLLAKNYNFTRASSRVLWEHIRNQSNFTKQSFISNLH